MTLSKALAHLMHIAYRNGKHGFTYNSNPGRMPVSGNVSIDNTERNYNFDGGTSVFRRAALVLRLGRQALRDLRPEGCLFFEPGCRP